MAKHFQRKPVSHFFLKRSLQIRLITKIIIAVMMSTIICIATLFLTYQIKYRNVAFYQVILDHNMDIPPRFEISSIILPGLIISGLVNLAIGIFIGFYASRKYAVPIFKMEQWADMLKSGKMTAKLRFREKEEFKDLSRHCNELGESLRGRFLDIKRSIDALPKEMHQSAEIQAVQRSLAALNLESDTIEVHTGMFRVPGAEDGDLPEA